MKLEQLQLKPALDSPRPTIRPFSEGHVSLAQPAVGSGTPSSPYAAGKIFTIDIREASSARAPDTNSWKTGVVEHALAFAEPASVRIYPGIFCKNPSGIMSMRIILVSCHRPTSRKLLCIRVGALSASRSSSRFIRLSVRVQHTMDASLIWGWHCLAASVPPTEQFLFGPDEQHDPL